MNLIFERGERTAPVGHALIYFRAGDEKVLATYVSVPPIPFDLSKYVPPFLSGALAGMGDLGGIVATPMPPIPEEVEGLAYLQTLAERRRDDLIFAGATTSDPAQLAQDAVGAAQLYGELYAAVPAPDPVMPHSPQRHPDADRFANMTEWERLQELTSQIGRLRDMQRSGSSDPDLERQLETLVALLPGKYRGPSILAAARTPGDRGQRLAALYLERSYKLFREEYLDLERIDREIEAVGG